MSEGIPYKEMAQDFLDQLPRGAFLTVQTGDRLNTMTIGWGSIGFIWGKPVMMVMVRCSRYTHELIQTAEDFTVSLPLNGEMKKSLATAGSKSGRDIDKFETCKLTARPAHKVNSPIIGECDLIYECRIVFKQVMDKKHLDPSIQTRWYDDEDYHVLYFGEILDCYRQG